MRISNLVFAVIVAASAAAPALAAERVSDAELVRASRCLGLTKAASLGAADPAALQAFIKTQGKSRDMLVQDRADAAERAARTEANRAKGCPEGRADRRARRRLQGAGRDLFGRRRRAARRGLIALALCIGRGLA